MSTHAPPKRPIPVVIVSGFLGSGKTTLMRRLIESAQERDLRLAVIINEFGEIDIDANILRQAFDRKTLRNAAGGVSFAALDDDFIASLAGGCACCAGRDELHETLLELASRAPANQEMNSLDKDSVATTGIDSNGANASSDSSLHLFSGANVPLRPDVILMEASGLADPVTLLEVVTAPDLLALVRVAALVGVVDAANYDNSPRALTPLLQRQLQLADFLILNKTDLIEANHLADIETRLRAFNPHAQLERSEHAAMSTAPLWNRVLNLDAPCAAKSKHETLDDDAAHARSHTLVCALPHPVEPKRLEAALHDLPDEVWRVKGFVRLRGEDGWHLVQYTGGAGGGRFQFAPFFLSPDASEPTAALVFIGGALDSETLRRHFGSGALSALW